MSTFKTIYDRIGSAVHSPYASAALSILFFVDAIIFFPADPLLVFYCLEQPHKAVRYATIATVAAVFGGLISYWCGFMIGHYWNNTLDQGIFYLNGSTLSTFTQLYQRYAWLTILVAGFMPIPFKAITLTAGFCKMPLIPFIIGAAIARGIRCFACAFVFSRYGTLLKQLFHRFCNLVTITIAVLIGFAFFYTR